MTVSLTHDAEMAAHVLGAHAVRALAGTTDVRAMSRSEMFALVVAAASVEDRS